MKELIMQVYKKAYHSQKENNSFKCTVKLCIKFTFIMEFIPVICGSVFCGNSIIERVQLIT